MRILQAGMAKSGNFWLYRLLQAIREHSGIERLSFIENEPIYQCAKTWDLSHDAQATIDAIDIDKHQCCYRIGSIFRMPIEDMAEYIRCTNHVWTHSSFCDRSLTVLPKFDKIVYIVRDPRDVAVSRARFAFTAYMKKYYPREVRDPDAYLRSCFEGHLKDWVMHVGGYLRHRRDLGIQFVFYERLLHSFDTELASLLNYLGTELDAAQRRSISEEVAFRTMKGQHPAHVRKGQWGQWTETFTEKQKMQAVRIAGPMLQLLHYSLNDAPVEALPCLPTQLAPADIDAAMAHGAARKTVIKKLQSLRACFRKGRDTQ